MYVISLRVVAKIQLQVSLELVTKAGKAGTLKYPDKQHTVI